MTNASPSKKKLHVTFWVVATVYTLVTSWIHYLAVESYDAWIYGESIRSPAVFATFTGKRYHTSSHATGYVRTTLFEAARAGLTPCEVCNPPLARLTREQSERDKPSYFWYGSVLACGFYVYYLMASAKPRKNEDEN